LKHNLQIEDLVVQNDTEVVFNAIDRTTGKPVMLRRFFPYGSNGRGLLDGERKVFERVINALIGIDHPGLCPVLAGGVDPVDGFPFMAVEQVAGDPLDVRLQRGLLRPAETIELLVVLLEVAIVVSAALGRDGLWLETATPAILWADGENRVSPVFRVAPARCLWMGEEWQAAHELIGLTEAVLGWQGVMVPDQAGDGLGAWIKELRAHPAATLAELRESLATATRQKTPPVPQVSKKPGSRPPVPLKPLPKRRSKLPLVASMAGLALMAGGGTWWFVTRATHDMTLAKQPKNPAPSHSDQQLPAASAISRPRSSPAPLPVESVRSSEPPAPPAVIERPDPPRRVDPATAVGGGGGVFQADEIEAIMARFHHEVVMEGVVVRVALSGNRKIWYLEFSQSQPPDKARAFLPVAGAVPENDLEQVKSLVGKRIRVRGTVDSEIVGRKKIRRPKVLMKTRDALEVLD
jgi:hypothetical protein